ncbi:MAG: hypothetical protein V1659_04205, partial [Candidatus Woesearchaeota archaeon]
MVLELRADLAGNAKGLFDVMRAEIKTVREIFGMDLSDEASEQLILRRLLEEMIDDETKEANLEQCVAHIKDEKKRKEVFDVLKGVHAGLDKEAR